MNSAQVSAGGVAETELCPGLFDSIVHDLFSSIIKQMYFKCWKTRYVKAGSEEACAHSQCAVSLQDDTLGSSGVSQEGRQEHFGLDNSSLCGNVLCIARYSVSLVLAQ